MPKPKKILQRVGYKKFCDYVSYDEYAKDQDKTIFIGRVRSIIHEIFPKHHFYRQSPLWAYDYETGNPFEFELFCEELKLVIECESDQHYVGARPFGRLCGSTEKVVDTMEIDRKRDDILKRHGYEVVHIYYEEDYYTLRDKIFLKFSRILNDKPKPRKKEGSIDFSFYRRFLYDDELQKQVLDYYDEKKRVALTIAKSEQRKMEAYGSTVFDAFC